RHALEPQLTAEQLCELAADRKPQARAAVLARGTRVRLLEGFENDLLLLRGYADPRVADCKSDDLVGRVEHLIAGRPAALRDVDAEADAALLRELERVRQQVLQHLQQPLRVGIDRAAELRRERRLELQAAVLRLVRESPLEHLLQARQLELLALDRDGAGLDLRQVQNVADQVQQ